MGAYVVYVSKLRSYDNLFYEGVEVEHPEGQTEGVCPGGNGGLQQEEVCASGREEVEI